MLGLLAAGAAAWGVKSWLACRRRIELDGRVIVITGASSGHGLVLAQLAAARGARLALAARDADALHEARRDLLARGARDVLVVPTDVRDPDACRALIDRTLAHYGRIDVLVNNAGIITVGPVESMDLADFRDAMETNFWGAVNPTLAALPCMRSQGFGRIAFVNSQGGKAAMPHLLPYTASKFALTGFTQGLRNELARDNILVTGAYPATMRTGGHTHALFKGDREAEYTWFGLTDTLPGISVSAEYVARCVWRAVCDGVPEVHIGWPTHLSATANGLFPSLTAEVLTLVNRGLPGPENPRQPAVRGEDLRGTIPDLLNRAVPPRTRPEAS